MSHVGDAVNAKGFPQSPIGRTAVSTKCTLRSVNPLREKDAIHLLGPEAAKTNSAYTESLQRTLGDSHAERIEGSGFERDGEERGSGGVYCLDRQPAVPLAVAIAYCLNEHLGPASRGCRFPKIAFWSHRTTIRPSWHREPDPCLQAGSVCRLAARCAERYVGTPVYFKRSTYYRKTFNKLVDYSSIARCPTTPLSSPSGSP